MTDYILDTCKSYCKCSDVNDFNDEIINIANAALMDLGKIGGCPLGTMINTTTTWDSILFNDTIKPTAIAYVGNKVQMEFDPPASSKACEAISENIKEAEWIIQQIVEGFLE